MRDALIDEARYTRTCTLHRTYVSPDLTLRKYSGALSNEPVKARTRNIMAPKTWDPPVQRSMGTSINDAWMVKHILEKPPH